MQIFHPQIFSITNMYNLYFMELYNNSINLLVICLYAFIYWISWFGFQGIISFCCGYAVAVDDDVELLIKFIWNKLFCFPYTRLMGGKVHMWSKCIKIDMIWIQNSWFWGYFEVIEDYRKQRLRTNAYNVSSLL